MEQKNLKQMTEEELQILYRKEMEREHNRFLGFTINRAFNRKAKKSHFCEICGQEISKGEYAWTYKPLPIFRNGKWNWQKWRYRCSEHQPKHYGEVDGDNEIGEGSGLFNNFGRY